MSRFQSSCGGQMDLVRAALVRAFVIIALIGVAAGADPYLVKQVSPQKTYMTTWTVYGGRAYFAYNDGVHGSELWCSDGSEAGTYMVKDICAGTSGSTPLSLTPFTNKLYFIANDGINGAQLWMSDGTAAGTARWTGTSTIKDIYGGANAWCCKAGHYLYFEADDTQHWNRPCLFSISDSAPNVASYLDELVVMNPGPDLNGTCEWDGQFCFAAQDRDDPYNNINPWMSDGTWYGTHRVAPMTGGIGWFTYAEVVAGGTLFFAFGTPGHPTLYEAWDEGYGAEEVYNWSGFWDSIHQIRPFAGKATFHVGGELYVANWCSCNWILYGSTQLNFLDELGGKLYFGAKDPAAANGNELWRTDGTSAGTALFKDLNPTGSSTPSDPVLFNNRLYFTATDGVHGRELWSTNGMTTGTAMVFDINSGTSDSAPANGIACGRTLFFTANDGVHGKALWALPLDARSGETVDVAAGDSAPIISATAQMTIDFASNSAPGRLSLTHYDGPAPGRTGDPIGYWQLSGLQDSTFSVAMMFNYDPARIAAAGLSPGMIGLFRSTDGGQTWTEVPSIVDPNAQTIRTSSAQSALGLYAIGTTSTPKAQVWVDFNWTQMEEGTAELPYNTLFEGVSMVINGGTVKIYTGSSAETARITRQLRIESTGGPVRIGKH